MKNKQSKLTTNIFTQMSIKWSSLFLLAVITTFSSCSKEEGPTGKDGVAGTNGADGNANVIYSDWASVPAATATTIDGTNGNTSSISAPNLTQEILDKGTVLVYVKFGSTIIQLPYTSNAGGVTNTLLFYLELNNIKLFRFKHDGTGGVNIPTGLQFRYILIPGGVSVLTQKTQLNLKNMPYSEVCKYLNIAE